MIQTGRRWCRPAAWLPVMAACWCGCGPRADPPVAQRLDYVPLHTTVAVAPGVNASGSPLDTIRVADLMASELSQLPGVGVIGVNRVLAVLAEQGVDRIQSPDHALMVCERLGADAIVVFAVTEYDAYTPVVGLVAELYGPQADRPQLDPVATSRAARPFPVAGAAEQRRPWAQVQRTFNADHESVREEVEEYAESREGRESPFGWRKYLASQELFLRFCCWTVSRQLVK